MPEYGRNVQHMIDHMLTIEDRDTRNKAAKTIVNVMGNIHPYLRDLNDYKHKLWDHLAIMANYQLDIDSPYPSPIPESLIEAPAKVPYTSRKLKSKHYGFILENLVEKAAQYEPSEEKEALIKMLANHMKKCYLTWNKDAVDDEKIYEDLCTLSEGRIQCNDIELTKTREIINPKRKNFQRPPRNPNQNQNQRYKRKNNNTNNNKK